jgi:hypothetical protein
MRDSEKMVSMQFHILILASASQEALVIGQIKKQDLGQACSTHKRPDGDAIFRIT